MRKFRAGVVVACIAALQAFALVVSAAPASAYAPPVTPDAPPRVAAPPPTAFKPLTTGILPNNILRRAPIGLTLAAGDIIGEWLRGLTGVTANPVLGCVDAGGKLHKGADADCSAPTAKPDTAPPSGTVVPDSLWGKMVNPTGTALDTFFTGQENTKMNDYGRLEYTITGLVPSTNTVTYTRKLVAGNYCANNPSFGPCGGNDPDYSGTVNVTGRCKRASDGLMRGLEGRATDYVAASSNLNINQKQGTSNALCPSSDVLVWVKILDAPSGFFEGAPFLWINPNAGSDLYRDTTITANLTCKNGSGGTVNVTASSTGTGVVPTAVCPAGYQPDSGSTSLGSGLLDAPKKIEEWTILPETRTQYEECIGWQAAGCIMRVELDGVDCSPGNPACFDWAEIQRLQPSRVKCKWGSYTIDISNCMPLRNGYQSESGISAAPSQAPLAAPLSRDYLGNPVQPNADPNAPPQWQPDYGTPGNPAPAPSGGTNPGPAPIPQLPNPGGNPGPSPVPTTPDSRDSGCWPSGSAGFNPLEWVLTPVKCALSWAFVPQQSVAQAQGTRIQTSLGKVPVVASIATVTTTVNTVGAAAGDGSGCAGPTFHFDFNTVHQEVQPFNACSEPVATMALVSRSLTTVVVVVLGVFAAARAFGAGMGFNFTLGKNS